MPEQIETAALPPNSGQVLAPAPALEAGAETGAGPAPVPADPVDEPLRVQPAFSGPAPTVAFRDRLKHIVGELKELALGGGVIRWAKAGAVLGILLLAGWTAIKLVYPPQEPPLHEAWKQSIAKLGITPLYPPQEDFYVGDIWVTVVRRPDDPTPFVTNSMRIGTLDLADDIRKAQQGTPLYSTTQLKDEGKEFRQTASYASVKTIAAPDIPLTLASFPALNLSNTLNLGGGFNGAALLGFKDAQTLVEDIQIPIAETYGAPAYDVYNKMQDWCSQTPSLCNDAAMRTLLSFAIPAVLRVEDGAYYYPLEFHVISRVFLMREISHSLRRAGSGSLQVSTVGASLAAAPTVSGPANDAGEPDAPAPSPLNGSLSGDRSSEFGMKTRVFERPLVFGYRTLTFALPPSAPGAKP